MIKSKLNAKKLYVFPVSVLISNFALAENYSLEEVFVTARKIEENSQDVPISVSAFTAQTLERRQITGTDDIGKIAPNLQFTNNAPLAGNNNSSVIFIRGVGQISPRANSDPGVGLYIDEVYMGQSVGGSMEMRDISNVQVLRGPQGTLFGRNTIGGAVVLSTTKPGDEFAGKVRLGLGEDNLFEYFGAIDLPVSESLKTRFTLGGKQQDGYVKRISDGVDLGDVNNTTFTAKALFTPSDSFSAYVNFDHTEADENGSPLVFAGYNNNSDVDLVTPAANPSWIGANQSVAAGCNDAWVVLPGQTSIETAPNSDLGLAGREVGGGPPRGFVGENSDPSCANNQWDAGPYHTHATFPATSTLENSGGSLKLEWILDDSHTLKSISAYRTLSWSGRRDGDNTPLTILHTVFASDGDQFSQELQYNYESERLTNVTGVYYYQEKIEDVLTVQVGDRGDGVSCDLADFTSTNRCHLDSDNNITENESLAFFTQFTYRFSDAFSGTFGVRNTQETKASTPDQFDYANPEVKYLPVQRYEADFSDTTVSLNFSYFPTDTAMLYASYSEGFKGGGWNSTFNFPLSESDLAAGHQFQQEEVSTYELGYKADLSDEFRLNMALFHSEYTDLQFTYRVLIAPWFFNAGEATIDGAELEFTWIPHDSWIVEGGIGYLDASIDQAVAIEVPGRPVNTGVEAGNQLPFAPEYQGNLGVGYNFNISGLQFSPRLDLSFSDAVFFDAANTEIIAQTSGYSTLDLSMAIDNDSDVWKFIVGVNNATNEEYRVSGNSSLSSGTGYAETAYARPRVIFANVTYQF